ncbi:MAG: GAF domain-containing protein [Ardenticatenaceae bacterium]|nr:GAF domain-containing protein [Ardenticatenaceae bacterium]MCB9444826.1 GAF domain-containing protein [Ardenticatenaceae bacterium]
MDKLPTFRFRQDLTFQLLMLYAVFVGLVIGAMLIFSRTAAQRLEADIKAADLALARAIAQETNASMTSALEAVRQLGEYTAVTQADPAGMEEIFLTVLRSRTDVNLIYRLDSQGTMLFHVPIGPDSTVGHDFSFRDYFQRALTSKTPLASLGRISPTTNQAVATAVMPLWDDNDQFQGLVATNIKLQSISHTLVSIAQEYPSEEGFQIQIVDSAGQIIAHSNPQLLLQDASQTIPTVVGAVLGQRTGNQIQADPGGTEYLYSYVPIYSVGWGAIVTRPVDVAFATPLAIQRGAYLAGAVFLAGGVFFWLMLMNRVIRPLGQLTDFSQRVGQDEDPFQFRQTNISHLSHRPDQMGYLARSLTRMQQTIADRLNELSTLLKTSASVVSSLDPPIVLDRILEQVEELLDIQMSAVFALDEQRREFRVQASRGLSQWYIDHTIIDPQEPGSATMRAIRSGAPVQISDTETNPSFVSHRERARIAGFRSLMAVPLQAQHAPPAALIVFRPDAHVFTVRETNLLASFANHAAMAIENAALFARSDTQLQKQTRRLQALVQSMQDGLILEDLEGRILYANRSVYEFCGLTPDEGEYVRGQSVESLMARLLSRAVDEDSACDAIREAVASAGERRAEFALNLPDKVQYIRLKVFNVTDSQDKLIGRGRILQDVTQRYEIDRMKSSLISTVSHELRTPLAAIKGYATTLLAEDVQWDTASEREFLNIISLETDHLSTLVNDLLDMSRIEAGNLRVSRTVCDLRELVFQAASRAHPRPGERLRLDFTPDLPAVSVDAKRIESVLRNLIENAVKYSGDGSLVFVSAFKENGHLVVQVADEGPGIPPEHQQEIFSSFYRVENGLTRNTAGAGLGLSISRGFIAAHGGEIWVEPGDKGTCVAFTLPLEEA